MEFSTRVQTPQDSTGSAFSWQALSFANTGPATNAALTSDLEAGKGTVGKLFQDETLYNNANKMLEETQGLIKAIRENPKKYLSIKLHVF